MLMQATDMTVKYGLKTILNHVDFYINEKERIGIVGLNGQGKSTLLKVIASMDKAYAHFATKPGIRIAYLPQAPVYEPSHTVIFTVMKETNAKDEYQAKSILSKLGIKNYDQKIGELSGGQLKRVALAISLISPCDLLVLDEPTNHLDIDMVTWLEKYLNHYKGAIVMSTHDRYFLENITTKIIEISDGFLYESVGGYKAYLEQKEMRMNAMEAFERKRKSILRVEKEWVEAGVEARRTKSKDRIARYEKLRDMEINKSKTQIEINTLMQRIGRKTITLHNLTKKFNNQVLFENFSFQIQPYERLGIIGRNGCGKTTLLNIISNRESATCGFVEIGETIRFGYFDQMCKFLDLNTRVYDYIYKISDAIETTDGIFSAKKMLEMFLFDDHTMYLPISRLSGGQQRRLYLLSVLMQSPNVLVLDEPTNDLDIETLSILESFLDSFKGIVITVSHDRYFLDRIVDRLLVFEDGKISIYQGNYQDYIDKKKEEKIYVEKPLVLRKKTSPKRLSYKENSELNQLEIDLPKLENALKEVNEMFNQENISYDTIQLLTNRQTEIQNELEEKEIRYLELQEKLESF